jgi:plasmid stabilization system protein ParE
MAIDRDAAMTGDIRLFDVQWSAAAIDDLGRIIDHIAADSPASALGALDRIEGQAASLEVHPDRGRIVPELRRWGITTYRELVAQPWRLLYRRTGDVVLVLAVIDGRRNVEDILLDRLTREQL